jgi:hypothetical protein
MEDTLRVVEIAVTWRRALFVVLARLSISPGIDPLEQLRCAAA